MVNMRGQPLMPTTQHNGKKLLKEGKAHVVQRCPFTIQFNYATGETRQPIALGVDLGYMNIGFSAKTDKLEVISGTLTLRKDVSKKLAEKRMYRRTRRGRLGYRPPRFDNRTRPEGWLAPSIQHKQESHIRLVETLEKLLPIPFKKVEVGNFDAHKMQNPEITGVEYQQGELQGYEVKEYLLDKWGRTCAYCGKTGVPVEVEHIVPKSRGGTDRVSNLTIACKKCNLKKGDKTAEEFGYLHIQKKAKKSLKATACLNSIRWKLVEQLDAEYTYGYVTKYHRNKLGLEKSHVNDAFVIAGGTNQERCRPYEVIQVRRNNRSLQTNRKGFKPSIRRQKYQLLPYDLVKYNNSTYRVKGVHCYGKRVLLDNPKGKNHSVTIKKVELVKYGKGLLFSLC
ncbi:RNA-guided endonuclease IscB [Candidatus Borrarchaeum sp.]|uniref:RNA-guided endonuclease IscB n=1 Tax=Candidatus Borrarchaeum sp. TaxID=2846742 RepID=UPI00257D4E27|nr:RNA-guided endonuclease IscB [Candidatus Borrarchaeum sp.]